MRANRRVNAAVCEHVNSAVKELLEVLTKSDEVEEGTAGLHLHQQIHVAVGAVFPARRGAKQADIAGTVRCRDSDDVLPLVLKVHRFLKIHSSPEPMLPCECRRSVPALSSFSSAGTWA